MARKVFTTPGDASLSKSIDSRLKVYGIAAAAASVSVLALAEPAHRKSSSLTRTYQFQHVTSHYLHVPFHSI